MTLVNMRVNGARTLAAWCLGRGCDHHRVLDVSAYADDLPVPSFGPRLRCERCGHLRDRPAASSSAGRPRLPFLRLSLITSISSCVRSSIPSNLLVGDDTRISSSNFVWMATLSRFCES